MTHGVYYGLPHILKYRRHMLVKKPKSTAYFGRSSGISCNKKAQLTQMSAGLERLFV